MHVPVHPAEEGGQDDGWSDQCGPSPHEVPERMSTGKRFTFGLCYKSCLFNVDQADF